MRTWIERTLWGTACTMLGCYLSCTAAADELVPPVEWLAELDFEAELEVWAIDGEPEGPDPVETTPAMHAMYEGMTLAQDERHDEAIERLEWAIEQDPTLVGAWETLGWSYWVTGREEDAATLWRRLVTIAPNEPMGHNLLAQVATRDGDFDRAEELYLTSLSLDPDQYEVRLSLGRVWLWGGKHGEAAELLQALFLEDPDRIDVEIELAWALYIDEQYEAALAHWNNINDLIPDNPTFLLGRANVLLLIGATNEAEADALRVLEHDPRNPDAMDMLATLAVQGQRPQVAVKRLRELMEVTDDDTARAALAMRIAVYKKSILDQDSDLFTRAQILRLIRTALDYDDTDIGTHLFYGEMLIADRQYATAERVFRDVLANFNPVSQRAMYGLLETFYGRMQLDRAERQLRENLSVFNTNNPYRHLYWARLHFARGDFIAALDALDRLEYEGSQGAVFALQYQGISPSEFSYQHSARQLREHLMVLRRAGFRFLTPSDLPPYFEQKEPAVLAERRPWLNRMVRATRHAWTGQHPLDESDLSDYVPDMAVMVMFDGSWRNTLRYGTHVMEDLGIRAAMFIGVGEVIERTHRYLSTFSESRDAHESGVWEIHSRLWDSGQLRPTDAAGDQLRLPLVNRLWLSEPNRLETLREYQQRVRHEFRDSRRVLAREFGLEEADITAVNYPAGEVGQDAATNIEAFRVPDVVLNEAAIAYRMGFIEHGYGYSLAADDRMLLKRWSPDRQASSRDVLRTAYRQHPVFIARRMRAEMAALTGRLHLALENVELLKRDGYPEEDLAELQEHVRRHLGRLVALPEAVEDLTGGDAGAEPLISLRRPHIGIEGRLMRANVMIDDREASIFGGLYINRRTGLQVRAGRGRIKQTVETNRLVEVQVRTRTAQDVSERLVENGDVTDSRVSRVTIDTRTVLSNQVDRTRYSADKDFVGAALHYTHESGSFTLGEVRYYELDGRDIGSEDAYTVVLEHQWRPVLAIDMAARYHRGIVPSARELIQYDSVALRSIWRIRDYWHATGLAYFAYFDDRNSLLKGELENLWQLSDRYDVWVGIENAIDTVDRDSDLYWTPFWDQRHALLLRLRRSYPNYFGMVRAHIGVQKARARREEREEFAQARALGEAGGWSPGRNPQRGWQRMIGFAGMVTRTFENGVEVNGEFTVNATDAYTEHTVSGRLMYHF